jgi:Holliday junction resolvase RusA-like endonuclease
MQKTETIFGQVIAKANHYLVVPDSHNGGKRLIKDDELRAYEKLFIQQCVIYKDRCINRPFKLVIDVFQSSNRFDLDNSLKTILDLLQYVHAISDDNLCMKIEATKHIDRERPRVVYSIEEYEPSFY